MINHMKYYLVIFIVFIATPSISQSLSRDTDSLALLVIYDSLDGPNWSKNPWDLTKSIDTYEGVTLLNNRVISLELGKDVDGVSGSIPAAIGQLSELKYLGLHFFSEVLYKIAPEICELSKLEELYIGGDGPQYFNIPNNIGNLTNLKIFSIRNSSPQLDYYFEIGHIPQSFFELSNLEVLVLDESPYSDMNYGYFYESLHLLHNLKELRLINLDGDNINFPMKFAQLQNLEVAFFSGCGLSGEIPSDILNLTSLKILSLYRSNISSCPDFSSMNLTFLELRYNIIDYASLEPMLTNPSFLESDKINIFPQMLAQDIDTLCIGEQYSISSPYVASHFKYKWNDYYDWFNPEFTEETDSVFYSEQEDENLEIVLSITSSKYPDMYFSNFVLFEEGEASVDILNSISRRTSGEECPVLRAEYLDTDIDVTFFPNPNNGNINISSIKNLYSVSVVNLSGKEMLKVRANSQSSITLNLASIPSGIYLALVHFESGTVSKIKFRKN